MSKFTERRVSGRTPKKRIVVLYHGDCSDGFGGAWAAWKKFGNNAEYVPLFRSNPLPKSLKGKELYFIDFTPNAESEVRRLIRANTRVTAIDHHISAKANVALTHKPLFALDHSGATLAWRYFHPGKKTPWLLRTIEDMDLWKFKMPHTKAVYAFLDLYDFNFRLWDAFAKGFERPAKRKTYLEKGKIVLRYEEKAIGRIIGKSAEKVLFAGYKTYAVNSAQYTSEIGSVLYTAFPPLAIIWNKRPGVTVVSLRSNGTVDVAKIAERFGGGGHKASSGFEIPDGKPLPWKPLKK